MDHHRDVDEKEEPQMRNVLIAAGYTLAVTVAVMLLVAVGVVQAGP